MPPEPEGLGLEARRLRLNTLIALRWLAVAGQTAAVLIGVFGLGLGFPALACFALIAASAALNLALRWLFPASVHLSERAATILLAYDILQLAGPAFPHRRSVEPLRHLPSRADHHRGGVAAPAPGARTARARARLRDRAPEVQPSACRGSAGEKLVLPPLYVAGVWLALAVSASFVTLYAYRVAAETRQTASALAAAELVLERAQHLSQLDGLAAAAAHELGTPLATVALVVREMAAQKPHDEAFADDLSLLEELVDRCRAILGKLAAPSDLSGQPMDMSSPVELAELAAAPHRLLGIAITVTGEGPDPPPKCSRNPGVLYGLGNLIENAVSFAEQAVTIRADWTTVDRHDHDLGRRRGISAGRSFPHRGALPVAARGGAPTEKAGGGLGLGLFIARSLLERSRATLRFENAAPPARGAVITVQWTRAAYEEGRRGDK